MLTQSIHSRPPVEPTAATTIKALVKIAEHWKVSQAQMAALVGLTPRTWERAAQNPAHKISLDQDNYTRASLLVGMFKGLRLLFDGPLTYGWPTTENTGPMYGGRSPIQTMIDGGIPTMLQVRNHIDAMRGGM